MKTSYIIGAILLVGTIAVPAWLLNRGSEVKDIGPAVETLDVVSTGRVDAEQNVISLEGQGKIVAIHVAEGAEVKRGDKILSLDDRANADMVASAIKTRDGYKLEKEQAKLKRELQDVELTRIQGSINAARDRLKAADEKLKQMKATVNATAAVLVTQADIDVYEAEIKSTRLNADAEQTRLDALRKMDQTLEERAAQLKIEAAELQVDQAKQYQSNCTITAPADGTIIRLKAGIGGFLSPNPMDPAIVFAPAGPLVVRAEVEQSDIGRVSVGMPATVSDETQRGAGAYKGRVTSISRWVAPKRSILLDPGNFNDVRTVEVVITLEPGGKPLLIGQRMVVRFGK